MEFKNMTFTYHIFNWTKAAVLINEHGANIIKAEACNIRHNEWNEEVTENLVTIFENGKPILTPDKNIYIHLGTIAFKVAKPTLILHLKNGETLKFVCATTKKPEWTCNTYWPEEAKKKLAT